MAGGFAGTFSPTTPAAIVPKAPTGGSIVRLPRASKTTLAPPAPAPVAAPVSNDPIVPPATIAKMQADHFAVSPGMTQSQVKQIITSKIIGGDNNMGPLDTAGNAVASGFHTAVSHIPEGNAIARFPSEVAHLVTQAPDAAVIAGNAAFQAALGGKNFEGNYGPAEQLGKGVVKGAVTAAQHPFRNLANTLSFALPVGGAVAGSIARGAAAVDAGTDADSIVASMKDAVARPTSEGGSLLHKPNMPIRTLTKPEGDVAHLQTSNSPGFRAFQKLHDTAIQHAFNRTAETGSDSALTGYGRARIGRYEDAVARSLEPGQLSLAYAGQKALKGLDPAEVEAIRSVVEGVTPQERIDELTTNLAQVGHGTPEWNALRAQLKAASKVKDKDMVVMVDHGDGTGHLDINPDNPKLLRKSDITLHGSAVLTADRISRGELTPEGAVSAEAAPGQFARGGEYETPTPGKLGRKTPDHTNAEAEVASLQARSDELTAKVHNAAIGPSEALIGNKIVGSLSKEDREALGLSGYDRPTGGHVVSPKGGAELERVNGALSIAKDKLQRIQRAATNRVEPTGMVGGERSIPNEMNPRGIQLEPRGHFTYKNRESKGFFSSKQEIAPVTGRVNTSIDRHPFTGAGRKIGNIPENNPLEVYRSLERDMKQLQKTAARTRLAQGGYKGALPEAADPADYVLVNTQEFKNARVSDAQKAMVGATRSLAADPTEALDKLNGAASDYDQWLNDQVLDKDSPVANEARNTRNAPRGYSWVNRRSIPPSMREGAGETLKSSVAWKVIDGINTGVKDATVYFKPGHFAVREGANFQFAVVHGSMNPFEIGRSALTWNGLSDEAKGVLTGIGGQGYYQALEGGDVNGMIETVAHSMSNFYARFVDQRYRMNALMFELRRVGIKTDEQYEALSKSILGGERPPEPVVQAIVRANREMGDYAQMTPFEQNRLRRVFFFYPWMKTSTVWLGRSFLEHPIKMGAVGVLGQQAQGVQNRTLGALGVGDAGMFLVGKKSIGPGGDVFGPTMNMGGINVMSTPAQLEQGIAGMVTGNPDEASEITQQLGPVAQAGADILFGTNEYGNAVQGNRFEAAAKDLTVNTPLGGAIAAATGHQAPPSTSEYGPEFPTSKSPASILERFGAGSELPRETDITAANYWAAHGQDTGEAGKGGNTFPTDHLDIVTQAHSIPNFPPPSDEVIRDLKAYDLLSQSIHTGELPQDRLATAAAFAVQYYGPAYEGFVKAATQVGDDRAQADQLYNQLVSQMFAAGVQYTAQLNDQLKLYNKPGAYYFGSF